MKRFKLLSVVFACSLSWSLPAVAQDAGYWRAESTTAKHITGDVALTDEKISINFSPTGSRRSAPHPGRTQRSLWCRSQRPGSGNL